MDITLKEHLLFANISTARACELFGRTERTLTSWNENPPPHVLEVLKLHRRRYRMPQEWENWSFDRHWIIDPAGNAFHINDVKNLWIERQLAQTLHGSKNDVFSLKLELEKRIKELENDVVITVELGGLKRHFDISLKQEKVYNFK